MAPHSQTTLILFILFAFSSFKSSESCGIAVYWGQNFNEGTLRSTCATGLYKYVNLAFLTTFGSGRTPVLNLAGHCTPDIGTCRSLSEEIGYCQNLGIQVLLSLGGASGNYSLSSQEDAREVANYLWTTFLAGNSGGPLGDAALNGIDFDIEFPQSFLYWEDLARALAEFSTKERKVYLSAAPQCPYPDRNLDAAIRTGLFDYVWVQFYNNQGCDYRSGVDGLLRSWNEWSSSLSAGTQLFMGLLASPQAGNGYISPNDLCEFILPVIKQSENYGGVMLWSRYWDLIQGYSLQIPCPVCDANLKLPSEGLYSN